MLSLPAKVAAIEFDGDAVRLALVRTGGRAPQVLAACHTVAEYGAPEERFDALVAAVNRLADSLDQAPAAYVLCAPSQFSIVRLLTIPFRGARKVAAAVPFELEPFLAFPIEELLVDHGIVAERSGETDVLAVGLRRALLEEQLAVLDAAGIDVEAAGLDAAGLAALWQALHRGAKGLHAALHVRAEGAELAVTNTRSLVFYRYLPITAADVAEQPGAVGREVLNTLRGFLAKWNGAEQEVAELNVTGLELDAESAEALSAVLKMPVNSEVMLEALAGGNFTPEAAWLPAPAPARTTAPDTPGEGPAPDWAGPDTATAALPDPGPNAWEAAIGVAVGAASGAFTFDFHREQANWRTPLRGIIGHVLFSACLAVVALMGWGLYYFIWTGHYEAQATELESQIAALEEEIFTLSEQGLGVDPELFTRPSLLQVLRELSAHLPTNQIQFENVRIAQPEARGAWLAIEGTADNIATVNRAFESLQQSALFAFRQEPQSQSTQQGTQFQILAYRPGAEEDDE